MPGSSLEQAVMMGITPLNITSPTMNMQQMAQIENANAQIRLRRQQLAMQAAAAQAKAQGANDAVLTDKNSGLFVTPDTGEVVRMPGKTDKEREANYTKLQKAEANKWINQNIESMGLGDVFNEGLSFKTRNEKLEDWRKNTLPKLSEASGLSAQSILGSDAISNVINDIEKGKKETEGWGLGEALTAAGHGVGRAYRSARTAFAGLSGDTDAVVKIAREQSQADKEAAKAMPKATEHNKQVAEGVADTLSTFTPNNILTSAGEMAGVPLTAAAGMIGGGIGGTLGAPGVGTVLGGAAGAGLAFGGETVMGNIQAILDDPTLTDAQKEEMIKNYDVQGGVIRGVGLNAALGGAMGPLGRAVGTGVGRVGAATIGRALPATVAARVAPSAATRTAARNVSKGFAKEAEQGVKDLVTEQGAAISARNMASRGPIQRYVRGVPGSIAGTAGFMVPNRMLENYERAQLTGENVPLTEGVGETLEEAAKAGLVFGIPHALRNPMRGYAPSERQRALAEMPQFTNLDEAKKAYDNLNKPKPEPTKENNSSDQNKETSSKNEREDLTGKMTSLGYDPNNETHVQAVQAIDSIEDNDARRGAVDVVARARRIVEKNDSISKMNDDDKLTIDQATASPAMVFLDDSTARKIRSLKAEIDAERDAAEFAERARREESARLEQDRINAMSVERRNVLTVEDPDTGRRRLLTTDELRNRFSDFLSLNNEEGDFDVLANDKDLEYILDELAQRKDLPQEAMSLVKSVRGDLASRRNKISKSKKTTPAEDKKLLDGVTALRQEMAAETGANASTAEEAEGKKVEDSAPSPAAAETGTNASAAEVTEGKKVEDSAPSPAAEVTEGKKVEDSAPSPADTQKAIEKLREAKPADLATKKMSQDDKKKIRGLLETVLAGAPDNATPEAVEAARQAIADIKGINGRNENYDGVLDTIDKKLEGAQKKNEVTPDTTKVEEEGPQRSTEELVKDLLNKDKNIRDVAANDLYARLLSILPDPSKKDERDRIIKTLFGGVNQGSTAWRERMGFGGTQTHKSEDGKKSSKATLTEAGKQMKKSLEEGFHPSDLVNDQLAHAKEAVAKAVSYIEKMSDPTESLWARARRNLASRYRRWQLNRLANGMLKDLKEELERIDKWPDTLLNSETREKVKESLNSVTDIINDINAEDKAFKLGTQLNWLYRTGRTPESVSLSIDDIKKEITAYDEALKSGAEIPEGSRYVKYLYKGTRVIVKELAKAADADKSMARQRMKDAPVVLLQNTSLGETEKREYAKLILRPDFATLLNDVPPDKRKQVADAISTLVAKGWATPKRTVYNSEGSFDDRVNSVLKFISNFGADISTMMPRVKAFNFSIDKSIGYFNDNPLLKKIEKLSEASVSKKAELSNTDAELKTIIDNYDEKVKKEEERLGADKGAKRLTNEEKIAIRRQIIHKELSDAVNEYIDKNLTDSKNINEYAEKAQLTDAEKATVEKWANDLQVRLRHHRGLLTEGSGVLVGEKERVPDSYGDVVSEYVNDLERQKISTSLLELADDVFAVKKDPKFSEMNSGKDMINSVARQFTNEDYANNVEKVVIEAGDAHNLIGPFMDLYWEAVNRRLKPGEYLLRAGDERTILEWANKLRDDPGFEHLSDVQKNAIDRIIADHGRLTLTPEEREIYLGRRYRGRARAFHLDEEEMLDAMNLLNRYDETTPFENILNDVRGGRLGLNKNQLAFLAANDSLWENIFGDLNDTQRLKLIDELWKAADDAERVAAAREFTRGLNAMSRAFEEMSPADKLKYIKNNWDTDDFPDKALQEKLLEMNPTDREAYLNKDLAFDIARDALSTMDDELLAEMISYDKGVGGLSVKMLRDQYGDEMANRYYSYLVEAYRRSLDPENAFPWNTDTLAARARGFAQALKKDFPIAPRSEVTDETVRAVIASREKKGGTVAEERQQRFNELMDTVLNEDSITDRVAAKNDILKNYRGEYALLDVRVKEQIERSTNAHFPAADEIAQWLTSHEGEPDYQKLSVDTIQNALAYEAIKRIYPNAGQREKSLQIARMYLDDNPIPKEGFDNLAGIIKDTVDIANINTKVRMDKNTVDQLISAVATAQNADGITDLFSGDKRATLADRGGCV